MIFYLKDFSNSTSSRMFTNHMSSNDRNWPVDLFMCRSQITKGMLCNWLHQVVIIAKLWIKTYECNIFFQFRHTLDGAANLLNNSKYFPSRVSLKLASVTKLGSVSRRIYRIFSHAYFHHRQIFLDFEVNIHILFCFNGFSRIWINYVAVSQNSWQCMILCQRIIS